MTCTATNSPRHPCDLIEIQYQLANNLVRASGLHEALALCLDAAMRATGLEAGGVYLVEDDGSVRLAHHHGLSDGFVAVAGFRASDTPHAAFVRRGAPLYTRVQDLGEPALARNLESFQALAIVPVWAENKVVGCLNLTSTTVPEVPADARLALEPLAQQIGQAIVHERTHAALRERETSLNTFFDRVTDFLFVLDERGVILRANETVRRQLGYSDADLLGQPVLMVHPPERRDEVITVVTDMLAGRRDVCTIPLQAKDGTCIAVETRISQGQWAGKRALFGVSRDVRDRQAAERADRWASLSVLAGGVAHDFNNILTAVIGNVDLAQLECEESVSPHPELPGRLRAVESAAQRAADLCQQMLAYSGHGQYAFADVDLGLLLRNAVGALAEIHRPNLRLEIAIASDLPPVRADAARLGQAIANLVRNASEAIGDASGAIALRAWNDAANSRIVLEIVDDGCGMDDQTCRRVCEPFFSTKFVGRGLGAAAAQGILRAHDGSLEIASAPGRGTTVSITLPVPAASRPTSGADATSRAASRATGYVLLVDDEPSVRDIGAALLRRLGWRVVTACDGRDALARYRERARELDLVILDLTMPGLDGAATFTALREAGAAMPVVIASGYATAEIHGRFDGPAPDGYLQKPYSRRDLAACLAEIRGREPAGVV